MQEKYDMAGYLIEINNLKNSVSQKDIEILFLKNLLKELLEEYINAVEWDIDDDEIVQKIKKILNES